MSILCTKPFNTYSFRMKSQTLDMAYQALGMKWPQPLSIIRYTLESAWNTLLQVFCLFVSSLEPQVKCQFRTSPPII